MKHDAPDPPELGERDGLSYALFLPEGEPRGGVVILHGAGSAKESHFDFGRALPRPTTWRRWPTTPAATGARRASGARPRSATRSPCATCCASTRRRSRCAARAWAASRRSTPRPLDPSVAAVVAICPAPARAAAARAARRAAAGLRGGRGGHGAVAGRAGPVRRGGRAWAPRTALLLLHAQGDEQVPYTVSEELHEAAHEPKRLLVFPGGHHRSLQHDLEVQNLSARFIERARSPEAGATCRRGRGPGPTGPCPCRSPSCPSSGFTPPTVWPSPSVTPWVVLPRPLVTPPSRSPGSRRRAAATLLGGLRRTALRSRAAACRSRLR